MKILKIKDNVVPLKIGLKGSMLLNETANSNVEENTDLILYCALLSNTPSITLNDLRELNMPAGERIQLAQEILQSKLTNEKIEELFSLAVGEIGISPQDAWLMTEEEINLAYEGYIQRQTMSANLTLLALQKARNKSWNQITLLEDRGYSIGTEEERLQVFSNLKI